MPNSNYCVYRHTAPNDKVYIGITSQNPPKRWANGKGYLHNKYFYRAIEKYGWENFCSEILAEGLSQKEAENMERKLILEHDATNPEKGFNILDGGDATSGLKGELNPMYGIRLVGELNPMYGKHHTDKTKQKIAESQRGKTWGLERRKAQSERIEGSGNPMHGTHRTGKDNPFYGKKHSDEAKRKISASKKGKKMGAENVNSKAVINLTTGEVFSSQAEAARKYGLLQGNISIACSNENRTCGKTPDGVRMKWRILNDLREGVI